MPDRLTYSVQEVAQMLGVPLPTVRAWIARGKVAPVVRVGRRVLVTGSARVGDTTLAALLEQRVGPR